MSSGEAVRRGRAAAPLFGVGAPRAADERIQLLCCEKYNEAISSARRFVTIHPGNEEAPYAQYLIAMSYYQQMEDVTRDQRDLPAGGAAFGELIRRYPRSRYASDARLKLDLINDHLAGKEMEIGRFYQRSGNWLAATHRFREVVDRYQTTSHAPEALERLVESYLALGIPDEAQKTAAVLGEELPRHLLVQALLRADCAACAADGFDPELKRPRAAHAEAARHSRRRAGRAAGHRVRGRVSACSPARPAPANRSCSTRWGWRLARAPTRGWSARVRTALPSPPRSSYPPIIRRSRYWPSKGIDADPGEPLFLRRALKADGGSRAFCRRDVGSRRTASRHRRARPSKSTGSMTTADC